MGTDRNKETTPENTYAKEKRKTYKRTRRAAKAKRGFLFHAGIYGIVMTFLTVINFYWTPEFMWVKWPAIFWGFGVIIHGLSILFFGTNPGLKRHIIESEMGRETVYR